MNHTANDWLAHPDRNPRITFTSIGLRGRRYFERSRWIPHQGKRECARRLRQMQNQRSN
jgi:hypothetical protein